MKRTGATSWIICPDCGPDEPRVHRSLADRWWWPRRPVAGTGEWDGSVFAVLREWARDGLGGLRLRLTRADPAIICRNFSELERRLLWQEAERRDVIRLGLAARGPAVSRPAWEVEIDVADQHSREAWCLWADSIFGVYTGPET